MEVSCIGNCYNTWYFRRLKSKVALYSAHFSSSPLPLSAPVEPVRIRGEGEGRPFIVILYGGLLLTAPNTINADFLDVQIGNKLFPP